MNKKFSVAALLALSVAGCSDLEMGPAPDTRIAPMSGLRPPLESATQQSAATAPAIMPATQPATLPISAIITPSRAGTDENGVIRVSVDEAILLALENNPSLRTQRYAPLISREAEQTARAAFDPTLTGSIQGGRTRSSRSNNLATTARNTDSITGEVGVSQFLPTGTTLSGDLQTTYSSLYTDGNVSTRAGISVTQSLLRGNSVDANLATLREARLDTKISQYELRAAAESLVSDTEQAYWDYALAVRKMQIVQNALDVAQQQLDEAIKRIRVGTLAPSERPAAEAEVASRKSDLIDAKSNLATTKLTLLRLMSPGKTGFWNRDVLATIPPFVPDATLDDLETHVSVSQRNRPDLNQAKLEIQKNQLEIVRTKNGLLPKLDMFVQLGKTGYSKSFGESYENLNGQDYDAIIGVTGEYAIGNRAARAAYQAAKFSKDQSLESLSNLEQLAQVDVRSAYIEVERTRQQIDATIATRKYREQALITEQAKFRAGNSTSLLVAQAQRDLLEAQLNEIQAVANLLKSLVNLYQQEGSLLDRRRIAAPGNSPVTLPAGMQQPTDVR